MAGRPVAARGGNGMLYGLIVFVIVAVASLGGFIWQLTANKALQTANESKARRLEQYGNPPAYYQDEASARKSKVFTVMNEDFKAVALLVTGKEDAVRPAILDASNDLLKNVAQTSPGTQVEAGDTLLTAVSKLHDAYTKLQKGNTQLQAALGQARLDNQSVQEGLKTVREEFEQQVAALNEEMLRLEQDKSEQLAMKDEQVAKQLAEAEDLSEELNQMRQQRQLNERNYDIETTRLKAEIDDLRSKIQELKPGGFDPYDLLKRADGRVLRAIPGSDVVYINLGREDRMRPGVTFEVFSATPGERDQDFRGKASVEVTAVLETSAECRVTRATPGRPILEGDILVNIAYDRTRLPEFVIRGEFDLNYDGEKEFDAASKVAAIVRAWGGRVVDEIDENTDFVVLGTGPQPLRPSPNRPTTDVIESLADSRLDAQQAYQGDIERARTLYVPIITQTQFLFLTGYSGQGPVLTD